MFTGENKAIVRRFFEAVFTEQRMDRADEPPHCARSPVPVYLGHTAQQAAWCKGSDDSWIHP